MTISDFVSKFPLDKNETNTLVQFVTGLSYTDLLLHSETQLTSEQEKKLTDSVELRLKGTPIAYITKSRAFYRDIFYVCEGVLIPQPDTEILVEEGIKTAKNLKKKSLRILDLCSGSGCVGISVANELAQEMDELEVVFSDLSPVAVDCTKTNADRLLKNIKYRVCQGDLFEPLEAEKFDIILTNPPYIPTSVIQNLESDVQHEPGLALDGGEQGLDIIKRITDQSAQYLNENSYLIMEIGYDQAKQVTGLFEESEFNKICVIKDLGMRNRVVKGLH